MRTNIMSSGKKPSEQILSEGDISVDRNIIKIGSTSYSVSSVGSVSLVSQDNNLGCILIVAALIISIIIGTYSDPVTGFVSFFIAAIVLILLNKSRVSAKNYSVVVKNSSGDQPIFTTKDEAQALRLKGAIEQAIRECA
ncbi:MAG: hypothetical protein GX413_10095 [Acetobacter sp.]|nr:hypothetical protein [Acetobacter sp.]